MALGVPFGNYRLVRRLARGGMAEVFVAWQLSSSLGEGDHHPDGFYDSTTGIRFVRQVAVKRILPHLSESDEFRALFLQEARLAATLSHPNVVHIHDFGRTGDCLFLAMELIEGIGLGALIPAPVPPGGPPPSPPVPPLPPLPIEHAVRIAADALAGLHHAHTRTDAAGRPLHIVHRDVSPQNVMITMDGVVKILDFGIAKAAWSTQQTRKGVVRGKYAYMSPEQAEGLKLDGRSDVYSLGVCLFELLAGAPLVPRDLPIEAALRAVRTGGALSGLGQLEILRPEVPRALIAILQRALQVRREQRYANAAEMQLDLERFLKGWPRISSTLLLGDYLRQHHRPPGLHDDEDLDVGPNTPVVGVAVHTGTDQVLPAAVRTGTAQVLPAAHSGKERVPAGAVPVEAPREAEPPPPDPLLGSTLLEEEEGDILATVVDPDPAAGRGRARPARRGDPTVELTHEGRDKGVWQRRRSGPEDPGAPFISSAARGAPGDPGAWEVIQPVPAPGVETVQVEAPQARAGGYPTESARVKGPPGPQDNTAAVPLPGWQGNSFAVLWLAGCLLILALVLAWRRGCL